MSVEVHSPVSVSRRHESLLVRFFAVTRLAMLLHAVVGSALVWPYLRAQALVAMIMVVIVAESVGMVWLFWRRGTLLNSPLVVVDVVTSLTGMVVMTLLLNHSADANVSNALYPYTVTVMLGAGMAFRLPRVLGVTVFASGTYLTVSIARFGFDPRMVPNVLSYFAWSLVCWALAYGFRRMSRELDAARRAAILHEQELAVARERAQTCRELHDSVLQTLEFLDRGQHVMDSHMRTAVRRDAAWLRAMLVRQTADGGDDLSRVLNDLVTEQALAGLTVELCAAGLADGDLPCLPAEAVCALRGAAREALTNVRKHAGVDQAVLRATRTPDDVVVTVLDHGKGMEVDPSHWRLGVPRSMMQRVEQVGGTVRIISAPGTGTYVELRVPLPATAAIGASRGNGSGEG